MGTVNRCIKFLTKGVSSGRTYTSKYREFTKHFLLADGKRSLGETVNQHRWAALTTRTRRHACTIASMVWCELHGQDSRGGKVVAHRSHIAQLSLNFDYNDYEGDLVALRHVSQDDLVQSLRRQGRMQASNNTGGSFSALPLIKSCPRQSFSVPRANRR